MAGDRLRLGRRGRLALGRWYGGRGVDNPSPGRGEGQLALLIGGEELAVTLSAAATDTPARIVDLRVIIMGDSTPQICRIDYCARLCAI